MNKDLKGFQKNYSINKMSYLDFMNKTHVKPTVYTCETYDTYKKYETEAFLNKEEKSLEEINNENLTLKRENLRLKKKLEEASKKNTNLKRSKLRLKNLLNLKIKEKEDEINLVCEKHYFEVNKLVEEHDEKMKEFNEKYVKVSGWEWETIEELETKTESDK